MKSLFIRIYIEFLAIIVLLCILAFVYLQIINKIRLEDYMDKMAKGTMNLIAQGVARHQGEKQQQWLGVIQRLTKMDIHLVPANQVPAKNQPFHVQADIFKHKIKVWHQLGKTQQFIQANINEIDEALGRITALLVLNELGRYKKAQRPEILAQLQQHFGYQIKREQRHHLALTPAQIQRLDNGDIFTLLEDSTSNQPYIKVFAPYGKTGDVLVLGNIPLFIWYPPSLLLIFGFSALFFATMVGFLMLRPLEKRFNFLIQSIDRIGIQHQQIEMQKIRGNEDELTRLAEHINNMSCRLHTLLNNQRELTHAVSHELRTPISRLRFRLELIDMEENKASRTERIASMQNDLTELNNLVDEILTYAKLESETPNLTIEIIQSRDLIKKLQSDLQGKAPDIQLDFSIQIEQFIADAHYIHRLLLNLLGNALRHAKNQVQVTVSYQNEQTLWLVEDDGEGIDKAHLEYVFEPFARLDESRNRQSGGYGLGLAISRKIAQWHQGELFAFRSELGGAGFILKLPSTMIED